MHTPSGIMGSSPEVLSWTSCPGLLVGKLKEELKLTVAGDAMKKTTPPTVGTPQGPLSPTLLPTDPTTGPNANTNANPPPQIITDLAPPMHLPVPLHHQLNPPRLCGCDDNDSAALGGTSPPVTALSEDSTREQHHFDNSMLQLQEHEEAGSPGSCGHGGCVSGGEEGNEEGGGGGGGGEGCPEDHHGGGGMHPRYHHPHDDIKLHFHRAGQGGGFLEGLFGCLKPVWNIIGKTYSTEYKLQQQGECVCVSVCRVCVGVCGLKDNGM